MKTMKSLHTKKNYTVLLVVIATLVLSSCKDANDEITNSIFPVSEVSLNQSALTLTLGSNYTLIATVNPDNATNKTITWTSTNSTVATVANGLITPVAVGTTIIAATAGEKTDSCLVTIIEKSNTLINADGKTGTLTDESGNTYAIIKIGEQWWMAENLSTTKYNDSTDITCITDVTGWDTLTTEAYCDLSNDAVNNTKYGKLYNWYAVNTGKLAPAGWHVASHTDWVSLKNYLIANGYNYDGTTTNNKIAKALSSKTGWQPYSTTGCIGNDFSLNNSSGFSALPAGACVYGGSFIDFHYRSRWWTATESSSDNANYTLIGFDMVGLEMYSDHKFMGYSVRCVKD